MENHPCSMRFRAKEVKRTSRATGRSIMKRHGYILFQYWADKGSKKHPLSINENFLETKQELDDTSWRSWDDIWDCKNRHHCHFFYLDIEKMKFFPLRKWKNRFKNREVEDMETEKSTIQFK
jgi:hypothetical protein